MATKKLNFNPFRGVFEFATKLQSIFNTRKSLTWHFHAFINFSTYRFSFYKGQLTCNEHFNKTFLYIKLHI